MNNQFHKKTIEKDRQMRELDFTMWADGWKCLHCTYRTEYLIQAKKHSKTHKKLEEFGIEC